MKTALGHILPEITSLSSKVELICQVGHIEDVGRRLVTETVSAKLEKTLRDEIRCASVDDHCRDRNLAWVVRFFMNTVEPSEEPLDMDDSPKMIFALLCTFPSAHTN